MKIDFNQILLDMECSPIKEGDKTVTLKRVATNALLTPFDDEKNLSGEEKVKRFNLASKIQAGDTDPYTTNSAIVDLKTEEIAEIKKMIGKAYTVLVVGQAWQMLEKEEK